MAPPYTRHDADRFIDMAASRHCGILGVLDVLGEMVRSRRCQGIPTGHLGWSISYEAGIQCG